MKSIVIISMLAVAVAVVAVDSIGWWKLDIVIDHQTVRICNEDGDKATIKLACVGKTADDKKAIEFIKKRLGGQRLNYYPLSTGETNWMSRPMCLFIDDLPKNHRGSAELVYHFPMLNEELLSNGLVDFQDVPMKYDEYGLKARLQRTHNFRKNAERTFGIRKSY